MMGPHVPTPGVFARRAHGPLKRRLALGLEGEEARVADQEQLAPVGDDGIERAAVGAPYEAPGAGADGRRGPAEGRVEDEVADDHDAAGDLALGVVDPAGVARARVQRVELAVI